MQATSREPRAHKVSDHQQALMQRHQADHWAEDAKLRATPGFRCVRLSHQAVVTAVAPQRIK